VSHELYCISHTSMILPATLLGHCIATSFVDLVVVLLFYSHGIATSASSPCPSCRRSSWTSACPCSKSVLRYIRAIPRWQLSEYLCLFRVVIPSRFGLSISPAIPLLCRESVSQADPQQNAYDSAVYGAKPGDRPLVHVFLVQESMQLDSLQSVC
jgi:hypothetical protein